MVIFDILSCFYSTIFFCTEKKNTLFDSDGGGILKQRHILIIIIYYYSGGGGRRNVWKEEDWHFRGVFSRETFGYVIVLAQFGLVSVPLSPPLSSPSFLFVLLLPSVVLKTIQKQPEAETLYCTAAIYSILSLNHEIGLSLYVCVNNLYNPPRLCRNQPFFFCGIAKKTSFSFPPSSGFLALCR